MRHGELTRRDLLLFLRRTEKESQGNGGGDRGAAWNQEKALKIDCAVRTKKSLPDQLRTEDIRDPGAESQNHEIEQALSAGASILWKELIHENVNGREEEGVT